MLDLLFAAPTPHRDVRGRGGGVQADQQDGVLRLKLLRDERNRERHDANNLIKRYVKKKLIIICI